MDRRALLKAISIGLAAACSAVVAVPGVRYMFSGVRRRGSDGPISSRLARLNDLPVGRPVEANVVGKRQDGWTIYPEETIGRVWLVRRSDEETPGEQAHVDAYSSICPHLGCSVQLGKEGTGFFCPCHKAQFDLHGEKLGRQSTGQKNPAPRAMDSLDCRVVQDPQTSEWWVEVKYEAFQQGLAIKASTV